MTEQEQRYLIRGMSLARVILLKAECPHHTITIVSAYQQILANSWNIKETASDVEATVAEINEETWRYLTSHPEMTDGRPFKATLKH